MTKSKLARKRVRSNSKKSRVSKQVGGNKLRRNTQMRKRKSMSRKRKSKRSNKNKKYTKKHRGGAHAHEEDAAKDAPGIVVNSREDREILSKFISVTDFIEELKTNEYLGNFFIYLKGNSISIESEHREGAGELIFQHDELIPAAIREKSDLSDWDAASNNEDPGEAARAASLAATARTASGKTETYNKEITYFLLPDLSTKKTRINNLITELKKMFTSDEGALTIITATADQGEQQEKFIQETKELFRTHLDKYIVPDEPAAGPEQPAPTRPYYITDAQASPIQSFADLVVDICHRIGLARQIQTGILILVERQAAAAAAPAAAAVPAAAPAAAAVPAAAPDVKNAVPNTSAGAKASHIVAAELKGPDLRGIEHFRMGTVYNFETLYNHIRNILLLNSYHNGAKQRLRAAQPSKINNWFEGQIGTLRLQHIKMPNFRSMELGAEHFTNLFNYILKASVDEPAQMKSLQFIIFIVEMIITIREARNATAKKSDPQYTTHQRLVMKYTTLKDSIEGFLPSFSSSSIVPSHAYFVTSRQTPFAPEFKVPS